MAPFSRMLALAFVALARSALAMDGVIEINQANAIAGGITSADTPGFPVTLIPEGSFRLTGNLTTGGPVDAIEITVSDVTLDLNGFRIRCILNCSAGDGIDATGRSNVTVLNGTVRNMGGNGVVVGDFGRVEGLRVIQNGGDGILTGDSSTVVENVVSNNGGRGISTLGPSTVSGNISDHNGSLGILCFRCTVTGNAVDANGGHGINAQEGVVIGNTVTGNVRCGIFIPFGGPNGGYGQNFVAGNNGSGANRQVSAGVVMGTNACSNGADCTAGPANLCGL